MAKLEAQAILENEGYDENYDIEYILEIYDELEKNIGFKDERRDKRFIVKFHDVFSYIPKKMEENEDLLWDIFSEFCDEEHDCIMEDLKENDIDTDILLTTHNYGHYAGFNVEIEEITKDNLVELAAKIYDEVDYKGAKYVKDYIYTVNLLQSLEDNYVDYWIDFLDANEFATEEEIKKLKKGKK